MDNQAKNKAKEGLPVVIGIPSMTFGEYDFGPTTGQLLVGIANQSLPGYVQGDRNVIYAGDAGLGLTLACEKGKPGERYLFTGSDVSMEQLAALMAKISNVPMPKSIPLLVAKIVSKIQILKYKRFNGDLPKVSDTAIAVMSSGQFLDGRKAQRELGFKSTHSLEQTIQKAYNWFVAEGYIQK
jgi:dihydroflavonol-4-reductase